jgi:hypothetical protein
VKNPGDFYRVFTSRFYVYSIDNIVGFLETNDVFLVIRPCPPPQYHEFQEVLILTKLGIGFITCETIESSSELIESWMISRQKSGGRRFRNVNTKV